MVLNNVSSNPSSLLPGGISIRAQVNEKPKRHAGGSRRRESHPSSVDRAIDGVLLYSHHALKRIVGEIELRKKNSGGRKRRRRAWGH